MAGYRPKSLDELNSLYDKSINAKNEIDKKASDFEVRQSVYTPAATVVSEPETAQEALRDEAPSEEISGLVGDFIKNFGAPTPIKRVRSVAPTTLKAVSSAKNDEPKAPVRQSSPIPNHPSVGDKPRLIRNTERNDLFENYKKVMDDDDDEEYSRHRLGRKRSKKLFEKKSAVTEEAAEKAAESEAETAAAAVEVAFEPELAQQEAVIMPAEEEIPETLENIEAVIEKVLGKAAVMPLQEEAAETEEALAAEAEEAVEAVENFSEQHEEEIADEASEEAFEEQNEEASEESAEESVQTDDTEEILEEAAEAYEQEPSYEISEEEPELIAEAPAEEAEEKSEAAVEETEKEIQEASDVLEAYEGGSTDKRFFANKNLILGALLLVLLLATAVSGIKAFAGINSDSLALGKYHLYSATENYAQARIKKGDLVVVVNENVKQGDIFAYKQGDAEYGLAEFENILNDDSIIADKDGQKHIVFKNTLRGVLYKTYPAVGTFAALIAAHYLYILGGLLLAALLLLLVIIFAFRKRKEEVQEVYYEDEQTAVEENTEYEAVEGDFRYLIQDEAEEDGFDVYRNDYDADGDEGLPVYEPEEYKYEPDEYVKN